MQKVSARVPWPRSGRRGRRAAGANGRQMRVSRGGRGGVSQDYDSGYDGVILEGRDAPRSRVSSFLKGLSW